ncbi:transposon Tf2-9 polyprotein [Trichonephila clavipes]|nr:transposon Tf2-9 polyprotein [Trichonephila clavipes]
MANKIFEALVDSGSSVSFIREDICQEIIESSELSKDIVVLSGLGKNEIKTKGSFQQKIELDGEEYPLTWHIVPTLYLKFEAVIRSDIMEQTSLYFHKESVQFRKHQEQNWSTHMQVCEAKLANNYVKMRREIFRRSKQKIKEPTIRN